MVELTAATDAELQAEVDSRAAAAIAAEAQATADTVQALIDADPKYAGITATADAKDPMWVEVEFPADPVGQPEFFKGVASTIADAYKGQQLGATKVRVRKDRAADHLATILPLLPDPI